MTLLIADVASYQVERADPLRLEDVRAAGFCGINIKVSQGNGYVSPVVWTKRYADRARQLGLAISTFHYLDNSASGIEQAQIAYRQTMAIGGPVGMVHQNDCEDNGSSTRVPMPATWKIWYDYTNWWQDKVGHHIAAYTGRWWWYPRWVRAKANGFRDWTGTTLTPYLWAAPNTGYLSAYPGDQHAAWTAGWGGWKERALLQYAVKPIRGYPHDLSQTAIRDRKVWTQLGGADPMIKGSDGEMHEMHEVAVDADRTPRNPEDVAGAEKPDPWVTDPNRWKGTEPWQS